MKEIKTYGDLAEEINSYFDKIANCFKDGNIDSAIEILNDYQKNCIDKYGKENLSNAWIYNDLLAYTARQLIGEILSRYPYMSAKLIYAREIGGLAKDLDKEIEK